MKKFATFLAKNGVVYVKCMTNGCAGLNDLPTKEELDECKATYGASIALGVNFIQFKDAIKNN